MLLQPLCPDNTVGVDGPPWEGIAPDHGLSWLLKPYEDIDLFRRYDVFVMQRAREDASVTDRHWHSLSVYFIVSYINMIIEYQRNTELRANRCLFST